MAAANSSKMVDCIMCARTLRMRLLGNHLINQHKVQRDQVGTVARIHLDKKCKKVTKKLLKGTKKKFKMKNCQKKPMQRSSLKKRFEDAIRGQYFDMDVFSKLLIDVSRDYHMSKINRGIEDQEIDKTFNDASILNADYQGDLKFRINLSSQKMEKSTSNDTSKLLDESLIEKGLFTSTLSESVFLPDQNSTLLDESMDVTRKTNVSKVKTSKAANMKTPTSRQKKKTLSKKDTKA